jgi:hypothetical protein
VIAKVPRPAFVAPPGKPKADVPTPLRGRALRRRMKMFKEATELLPFLPTAEGEATHAIMSGRYDLMVLLAAVLEFYGVTCQSLRCATLSWNARNIGELVELLRSGRVQVLTLMSSAFHKAHREADYAAARTEAARFPGRWRMAATRSHAKIITAAFDDGRKLVFEGSANLRTNSNAEQLAIVQDAALHNWFAEWIDRMVSEHEHEEDAEEEASAGDGR